jgi:FG-GAP-like repeat
MSVFARVAGLHVSRSVRCLSITSLLLVLIAVSVPAATQAVRFSAPASFPAGSGPASVAVGDFNGTGGPDLVVANHDSDDVSILLGNGSGGFTGPTNFAAGDGPFSVAVGAFDDDSYSDLAITNYFSNRVSILLGDGAGGFNAGSSYPTGSQPRPVVVANLNGDSNSDLVVGNHFSGNVSILLGDGSGGFTGPTNFAAGSGPHSVAVGDFGGTSGLDLAVANRFTNSVSILLGDGSGGFADPTSFAAGSGPLSIVAGDFNGAGGPDLAVGNEHSDNVSILLGDGSGGFTGPTNFAAGDGIGSVAVGNLDGVLGLDLATAAYNANVVPVLLGDGTGGFTAPTNFATGNGPNVVAVRDLNGAGGPDLAVANYGTNNVSVLLNTTQSYPRPRGATPLHLSLVPVFKECTEPNSTHNGPLAFPSCDPPELASDYVTIGEPQANGRQANFIGSAKFKAVVGNPSTPEDEADNGIEVSLADIRKKSDLEDYTGEMRAQMTLRMTDRLNGVNGTNAATVQDFPFSFNVPCTTTAATNTGSSCALNTTADTLVPGMVPEEVRTVTHIDDFRIYDGGSDGNGETTGDNTAFAWEGIFTP